MILVVITILTTLTLTTTIEVYAGGDDDNNNRDGNKQKAEDDSAAAIADCDDNEVERAGFDCIAIAANDVEIETAEEPPEESAILTVCKETSLPQEPEDFAFTVTRDGLILAQFEGDNEDGCVDVDIGLGEYTITEETDAGVPEPDSVDVEDACTQDPNDPQIATGEIEAGGAERCIFINNYLV